MGSSGISPGMGMRMAAEMIASFRKPVRPVASETGHCGSSLQIMAELNIALPTLRLLLATPCFQNKGCLKEAPRRSQRKCLVLQWQGAKPPLFHTYSTHLALSSTGPILRAVLCLRPERRKGDGNDATCFRELGDKVCA